MCWCDRHSPPTSTRNNLWIGRFAKVHAPLSATTIARVNTQFHSEFVYVWADGIHLGADPQGIKHLISLDEAMSESEMNWQEILHDLKERGLRAPRLAIADGANGFWAALAAEYPNTAQQRCWLHKIRNVLDKVPERLKADVQRR